MTPWAASAIATTHSDDRNPQIAAARKISPIASARRSPTSSATARLLDQPTRASSTPRRTASPLQLREVDVDDLVRPVEAAERLALGEGEGGHARGWLQALADATQPEEHTGFRSLPDLEARPGEALSTVGVEVLPIEEERLAGCREEHEGGAGVTDLLELDRVGRLDPAKRELPTGQVAPHLHAEGRTTCPA